MTDTGHLHNRLSFGGRAARIAGLVVVWAVLLVLLRPYVKYQYRQRQHFIHQPLTQIHAALDSTLDLADGDPPGSRLLQGERADVARGDWQTITGGLYSERAALYTNTPGAELRWNVALQPGTYRVTIFAYAYPTRAANTARVLLGPAWASFKWAGSDPERRVALSADLHLKQAASHVAVSADKVGQPFLVIDAVSVVPVDALAGRLERLLLRYALVIASVALLLLCSAAWGALLIRRLVGPIRDPLAQLVLAQGTGLAAVGTLTTVLGTAGWFGRPVVLTLLALGVIVGGRALGENLVAFVRRQTALFRHFWFTCGALSLAGVMLFAALAALAPAVGVDPLLYHIPIAKWLVFEGRFDYHPYHLPWGFPHLISNLYALGLSVFYDDGFRTAVLINACLGMLWIASAYCAAKLLWGRAAGLAAAALCLAMEGVAYCFSLAFADLGFAAFSGCALVTFILAIQGWEGPLRPRYLLLAALIAGAASVCKVQGPAVAITLGVCAALYAALRSGWRQALASFLLVGTASFLVASPMYVKNYALYGNPLHPFSCGFSSEELCGVDSWALFGNSDWPAYVRKLGAHAYYRWPYDWMKKRGVDWLTPGPAFAVGFSLALFSGREFLRRHWPILAWSVVLAAFWFAISPLARFGWPWLAAMTLFACAPLSEQTAERGRRLIPIVLLAAAVVPLLTELERSLRTLNVVSGASSEQAYLARMEEYHAGENMGPPLEGIRALNRMHRRSALPGRVLIDTNMVAYADFPTVPAWYYLIVQAAQGRIWWKADGYPFLSMAGKLASDDEMLAELRRLNIGHILVKKGTPTPAPGPDGRYHYGPDAPAGQAHEDRFDVFIERWKREGRVTRIDFADSILYSLCASAPEG